MLLADRLDELEHGRARACKPLRDVGDELASAVLTDDDAHTVAELRELVGGEVDVARIAGRNVEPEPAHLDALDRVADGVLDELLGGVFAVGLPDRLDARAEHLLQAHAPRQVGVEEHDLALQEDVGVDQHDREDRGGDGERDLAGESHGADPQSREVGGSPRDSGPR